MKRSRDRQEILNLDHNALQHEPGSRKAPRPLPLFLEMVRQLGERDPDTARAALQGLAVYEQAGRPEPAEARPIALRCGPALLRAHGGDGPPAVLVPSLINPPDVLDLDPQVSLSSAIRRMGRSVYLVDWGSGRERSGLSVGDHVRELLADLISGLGEPAALIGYCLGGTMAVAAANLLPVERVVTLAAPWDFSRYPTESRNSLLRLWTQCRGAAESLGVLPMELLQVAFWSLDPQRTVAKFAGFSTLPAGSPAARRFIALEDWANEGEPLPFPAARELIEDFFEANRPGRGCWEIGGKEMSDRLQVPVLHCTARNDRITPAETAAWGESVSLPAGHVGMIVGSAREALHDRLDRTLRPDNNGRKV